MTCKAYIQDIQQKPANQKESNTLPKWLHHLEQSIKRVRKELNHINLLIKCKKENSYSKHQKKLLNKFRKKPGNTTLRLFEYKSTILKQELKSKSEKLKYQKKLIERKRINMIFQTNPKKVFRSFKENSVILKAMPSQENVETFWKGIWESRSQVNYETLTNGWHTILTINNRDESMTTEIIKF